MDDKIDYDLDAETDSVNLLRQIAYRLDRHFPAAESDQNLVDSMAAAKEKLDLLAEDLRSIGLNEMADEIGGLVE